MTVTHNECLLTGYVEKEPLVHYTSVDAVVAAFRIETIDDEFVNDKGKTVPECHEWHRIVAWNELAKYVEMKVKKGMLVSVKGKLRTRSYVDKSNVMRFVTEIHAYDVCVEKLSATRGNIT